MAFYGAIEQVLTGWIFDVLPAGEAELERGPRLIVETICGGLRLNGRAMMESDLVKRLIWSGLLAGLGALVQRGHPRPPR